jgi:predicted nuclease of restriction endonuclease-like (RecB) superfamily
MGSDLIIDKEYKAWLSEIKLKVRNAQIKATLKVQTELLTFYWEFGADIVAKQTQAQWGDGVIDQLSRDLMAEFPDMKGFSRSNLMYIKKWHLFYRSATLPRPIAQQAVSQLPGRQKVQQSVGQIQEAEKSQQVVGQTEQQAIPLITRIPWGHNIAIVTKCKNIDEALYYVECTLAHNWSRSVLVHQMESGLYQREGRAVTNFALTLPDPQSGLAIQTLKDPYVFDFLTMVNDYNERDLVDTYTALTVTHLIITMPMVIWLMVSFFESIPAKNQVLFSLILSGPKTKTVPVAVYNFISYGKIDWQ